ncbi:MAG: YidC/Oxa1 family membrane protein insertase [Lachnospiraceae bacterium]|nr:YidC/Oxa1 family membrane protein insertase [Lachnospiraceae bacterium]
MILFKFIFDIAVMPIRLLLEYLFCFFYKITNADAGLAVVFLSLAVNCLVLPFYELAESAERKKQLKENIIDKWRKHINSSFKGDERIMILSALYRENHYRMIYSVSGMFSLLLEIPIFMAAYQSLSEIRLFKGAVFLFINDLSKADGLLDLGNCSINILPVLMTVLNILSGAVYSRKQTKYEKTKLIVIALVFLLLLYPMPSGLVLYWTLNNLFSLCKNLVKRLSENTNRISNLRNENNEHSFVFDQELVYFLVCGFVVAMLLGLLVPSQVVASSPLEFSERVIMNNPTTLMLRPMATALGIFVFWPMIIYYFSGKKIRKLLTSIISIICFVFLQGYMFSGNISGALTEDLELNRGVNSVIGRSTWRNSAVVALLTVLFVMLVLRHKKIRLFFSVIFSGITLAAISVGIINMERIHSQFTDYAEIARVDNELTFSLDKKGKNVVMIIVDSAVGMYFPYFVNEDEDLYRQYDGFTLYLNTLSTGPATNYAIPGVYGGYEYTPAELNKRDDDLLEEKHNEALMVLPVFFAENGYETTVFDPAYAGYSWIPDLSIFCEYPEIRTANSNGTFNMSKDQSELRIDLLERNLFCYSATSCAPYALRTYIYQNGSYGEPNIRYLDHLMTRYLHSGIDIENDPYFYRAQFILSDNVTVGERKSFLDSYSVLENLSNMTIVTDEGKNTFMSLYNSAAHDCMFLQAPEYAPSAFVDNTEFYDINSGLYSIDGVNLRLNDMNGKMHYQSTFASLKEIGKWLDYLRDNDLYDNTRIVIVSDHGRSNANFVEMLSDEVPDIETYSALLLYKDFGSSGFSVSYEPMTNADTPALLVNGIVDCPLNPFTGRMLIDGSYKSKGIDVIYGYDNGIQVNINNGKKFLPTYWFRVDVNGGMLSDPDNWTYDGIR